MHFAPSNAFPICFPQDEVFEIVDGLLGYVNDGKEGLLRKGEKVTLEAGKTHTFWNAEPNTTLVQKVGSSDARIEKGLDLAVTEGSAPPEWFSMYEGILIRDLQLTNEVLQLRISFGVFIQIDRPACIYAFLASQLQA